MSSKLLILLIILSSNFLFSQEINKRDYDKALSINTDFTEYQNYNIYQKDFFYLTEILEDSHPDIYNSIGKRALDSLKDKIFILLDNADSSSFLKCAKIYTAQINDPHTNIYLSNGSQKRFPIDFKFIKGSLFVSNTTKEYDKKALVGRTILKLNNRSVADIFTEYTQYESGNKTHKQKIFTYYVNNFRYNDLLNFKSDTLIILTETNHQEYVDTLHAISKHPIYTTKYKHEFDLFSYEILKDSICYFKYNECYDLQYLKFSKDQYSGPFRFLAQIIWRFRGGHFDKFLVKMFKEMEDKNIKHLIVDLSSNAGGSSLLGDQFLYYLSCNSQIKSYSQKDKLSPLLKFHQPDYFNSRVEEYNIDSNKLPQLIPINPAESDYFNILTDKESHFYMKEPQKYKGNLYMIIGDKTFSSAAMLATMLYDNKLCDLVVGSPISNKPSHFGETMYYDLPYTGAWGYCSTKQFIRPDKDNETNIIKIDVEIYNSISDLKNSRNRPVEYLMKYIMNKKSLTNARP